MIYTIGIPLKIFIRSNFLMIILVSFYFRQPEVARIANFSQKSPKFSLMSNGLIYTIGMPLKIFIRSNFLMTIPVSFYFRQPEVAKIAKFSQKSPQFSFKSNRLIYTILAYPSKFLYDRTS